MGVAYVGYQLPTKLLNSLLPSCSYLRYLCYMHILLGLRDILGKFTFKFVVEFIVKYFNACVDSPLLRGGDICMR